MPLMLNDAKTFFFKETVRPSPLEKKFFIRFTNINSPYCRKKQTN